MMAKLGEVKMVKLGEIIQPAKTVKCGDGKYPVLSMTMRNGLVFQDEKFKKEVASKDKSGYKVVKRNQLVVGFPIDEAVLATQRVTDAGIVSPAYAIWDFDEEIVLPVFLETALRCERAIDYYKSKLRGSTARRRSLPNETFLNFEIPLPSLEEQRRVAGVLDKVTALMDARRTQLTHLDTLIKARFVEMFGDININDKQWEIYPLGELCTIVRGGSPRPIEKFLGGDVPWIKIGDATAGDDIYLNSTKEHIIQEGVKKSRFIKAGSLIFANCGVSLGFARIITFDGCIHDGWLAMEDIDSRLDKVFLLQALNQMTEHFRKIAPAGTQPNLNTAIMKSYMQIVPPMELQKQYIDFVAKVDGVKAGVQASLEELDVLKKSLMQTYFG